MKRFLKRFFIFLLIMTIFTNTLFIRCEIKAEAAFAIDDACIALLVGGYALVMGSYAISTTDSPQELFTDMFGEETLDNLREYFKTVVEADAVGYLADMSDGMRQAATLTKKEHKHAVVQEGGGFYKYIDDTGNVRVSDSLPFAAGTYYLVDSLPEEDEAYTSGNTISKEALELIKSSVASCTKTIVKVGKNILGWTLEQYDALVGVHSYGLDALDSVPSFLGVTSSLKEKYAGKTAFVIDGGYPDDAFKANPNYYTLYSFAVDGIMFELRNGKDTYYGIFSADRFNELKDSYSSTGFLNVFTGSMSSELSIMGPSYEYGYDLVSKNSYISDVFCQLNGFRDRSVTLFNNDGITSLRYLYVVNNSAAIHTKPLSSACISMLNNGDTSNYVIGTVAEDGSISYDILGESEESSYLDGIETGDTSVKVAGDVEITDNVLGHILDNTMSVGDINNEIADVNDSVIAVDNTISNGFDKSNSWLEKIWDSVTSIPSAIESCFSRLWSWLERILSSINSPSGVMDALSGISENILDVPSDIVSSLDTLADYVVDIPTDIVSSLEKVGGYILDLPADIVAGIGDIAVDVGDLVLDIPASLTGLLNDIWDSLKSIPGNIVDLFKELLIFLFVPSDTFFNNWNNKFNSMLVAKLPYDTYNSFFNDMKEISGSRIQDVTMTVYGKEVTILSFSYYYQYEDTINDWIRGVMFFVLVFFNINQMYKLIRGTSLYKIDKYFS